MNHFKITKINNLFITTILLTSLLIPILSFGAIINEGTDILPGATKQTGGQAFGEIPSGGSGRVQTIRIPNPLQAKSFQELIQRIVNWLLVIGAPILVLMIIIGAFQIMTGAGNPENITKGRHTITYAVIGYALLLLSNGIILIIKQLLGVQ